MNHAIFGKGGVRQRREAALQSVCQRHAGAAFRPTPLGRQNGSHHCPPPPRPTVHRLLPVQNIHRAQLLRHIVHREGVPSRHFDMRTGEGGGPDSGYLVRQCSPAAVVLLQRHTAGGYPSCRDSRPTAAVRVDFWPR